MGDKHIHTENTIAPINQGNPVAHAHQPVQANGDEPAHQANEVGLPIQPNEVGPPIQPNAVGPPIQPNEVGHPIQPNAVGHPIQPNEVELPNDDVLNLDLDDGPPAEEGPSRKKKEYDRNHEVSVSGTSTNPKGELVINFVVKFPRGNRSTTDYRGQLTMRQMQNSAVALEKLSHSLKPRPQVLIPDPYEDYASYLKECFVKWETQNPEEDVVQKEIKIFKAQGWYKEADSWYFVTGHDSVWNITDGTKLTPDEIQDLGVTIEFNGKEKDYQDNKIEALQLLSELISTWHTVGDPKFRSFFPCAISFFYKGLLFVPRVQDGRQNKFGLFLSGPKPGSGKTKVSEMLQKMSMDADEIAKCRVSHSSTLVGIYRLMDSSPAVFLDEIKKEVTSHLQAMASIIDNRWSNSPHTTSNETLFPTSAVIFCGNYSLEQLMSFQFKREAILQEKTMSKTTIMYSGNKAISGGEDARERCFEIASALKKHLPILLHLSMKAFGGKITEEERRLYLHIHKDDRIIIDIAEYRRWALFVRNEMIDAGVEVPDILKNDDVDVFSMAYCYMKGRTSLKDLIKFCIRNDRTDELIPTKIHGGTSGFKVREEDFGDAPEELRSFLARSETRTMSDKNGVQRKMKFLPSTGLNKKDLELITLHQMSVNTELCKALTATVKSLERMQNSFVNSFKKEGLKRKRPGKERVVEKGNEKKQQVVEDEILETVNSEEGKHKEGLLDGTKAGPSGGLACTKVGCLANGRTFRTSYHYKTHIESRGHLNPKKS